MDWGKFIDRPWQWFYLSAAILNIYYLFKRNWLQIRRKAATKVRGDPDQKYPLNRHHGFTLNWIHVIATGCIVFAHIIALWHITKWAYTQGNLPDQLTPILSTIFGSIRGTAYGN